MAYNMNFSVDGQCLRLVSVVPIVANTINYLAAGCTFSEDWDGTLKLVHFAGKDNTQYDIYLDGSNEIPKSAGLNLPAGRWNVSLTGTVASDDGAVLERITTNSVSVIVERFQRRRGGTRA